MDPFGQFPYYQGVRILEKTFAFSRFYGRYLATNPIYWLLESVYCQQYSYLVSCTKFMMLITNILFCEDCINILILEWSKSIRYLAATTWHLLRYLFFRICNGPIKQKLLIKVTKLRRIAAASSSFQRTQRYIARYKLPTKKFDMKFICFMVFGLAFLISGRIYYSYKQEIICKRKLLTRSLRESIGICGRKVHRFPLINL